MTDFLELLTAWLLDFYVLATLLLAVEGLAASLVRRPTRRLALAHATLIGLAVLAVLLALPGRARLGLGLWRAADVSPPVMNLPDSPADLRPPLAGLFLVGLALTTAWLVLGACRAWLVSRRSRPAPSRLWQVMHGLVGSDGQQPRLHVGFDLAQPVALGAWRPLLLLPADLAQQASPQELEAVLAHELAHVQNGDLRWAALSRALLLALFAHPLYWILRRRLRADQELQADATAAARAGAFDYAATLVGFAGSGRHLNSTLPVARRRSAGCTPLKRRIAALLHPDFCADDRWAPRWHFAAAVLTVLTVAVLSPVTLRELGEPDVARPSATMAQLPVAAPQSVAGGMSPIVKIEIVLQVTPAEQPTEKRPPSPKIALNRLDFTLFVVDWVSKHQADWLQRLLMWWFAERVHRSPR